MVFEGFAKTEKGLFSTSFTLTPQSWKVNQVVVFDLELWRIVVEVSLFNPSVPSVQFFTSNEITKLIFADK